MIGKSIRKIKVKPLKIRKEIPQSKRCQNYGHT